MSHSHMDYDSTPFSLHLHIQLPEHVGLRCIHSKNAKKMTQEEKTPASYTWTEEHADPTDDSFHRLLWSTVLDAYGIQNGVYSRHAMDFASFLGSPMYRHSDKFPHTTLQQRMELYIEEYVLIPQDGQPNDVLSRRRLLRTLFQKRGVMWSPHYYAVYMEWVKTHEQKKNRYQKMETFLKSIEAYL